MKVPYKHLIKVYGISGILVLALLLSACGGGGDARGAMSSAGGQAGADLYQQTCAACHGPNAKGVPGLGKDLTTSLFVQSQSDQALLAFIKQGRMPNDPGNTSGVPMPPKGGNPSLTDEQILEIIAFIHTLD